MAPLLDIRNLCISVRSGGRELPAVRDVSLSVAPGEVLAIVGESGSGKSLTALSVLGLLSRGAVRVTSGEILFEGEDLAHADPRMLDRHRGRNIGMIFQEPLSALNPVLRIGDQITEGLVSRGHASASVARKRALAALTDVRVSDPERRLKQYPHELSGGMRQRVMIALALIASPRLLIADEPTTALDVTIQAQILALIGELQREAGMAMILVTHDLGVVAEVADRVAVMYAGRFVETGPVDAIFSDPQHPYTLGLIGSLPSLGKREGRLATIAGSVPPPQRFPVGCRFATRCPFAEARCFEAVPPLVETGTPGHRVACFKAPLEDHVGGLAA